MSWFAIAGTAVSVTGSIVGANSSRRSARQSQQNYANSLNRLLAGAGSDVFGTVPEHVPYVPVDITQSQLDTIAGNRRALPSIERLVDRTNRGIIENDLNRIRRLAPGYDDRVADMFSEITANMKGDTNLSDFFPELIRNRAEISGAIGTPGTSNAITTRDLGLGALSLQDRGMSMFQSWLNTANQNVSPIASQLVQQSGQAGAYPDAMPDPTAAGMFQARLGALAQTTPQAQPSMLGPILQGAGSVIGAAGSAYERQIDRRNNYYYGTPMNNGYRPPSQYGGQTQYANQSYVPSQTGYNNYGPISYNLDRPPAGVRTSY
jgi:hypothetical protein